RAARIAAELEHDNVVRARAVVVRRDEISIACDFVDGERLSELWQSARPVVPIGVLTRILVDVLTGLSAIHKLKDSSGSHRLKIVHGLVTPSNVLVGLDGVSRLLRTCRVRQSEAAIAASDASLAPEIASCGHVDQRADVFGAGVLLSQALAGRS